MMPTRFLRPERRTHLRRRLGGRGGFAVLVLGLVIVSSGCNGLAFGRNVAGQLGDGTTDRRLEPVTTVGSTTFETVSAGEVHTCGIAEDAGTIHCWGEADRNRLGLGIPFDDRTEPTQMGSDTDWVAISAGGEHTCAIKAAGSLWCWGDNKFGQSAPDTAISLTHPVPVDGRTDWRSVSAGERHTCAVRTSGNLFCWGHNEGGNLGAGDTRRGGIRAIAGAATWESVDVGRHTCGVMSPRGRLFCWGSNGSGQLGVGDTQFRTIPTRVGTDENWESVGAGESHTCARKSNSSLHCWGSNALGQVGDGSGVGQLRPVVVGGSSNFLSFSVGNLHTCAIRAALGVWCWGSGAEGQLGNGATTRRPVPTPIAGAETIEARQVSAGGHHTQIVTRSP